MKAMRKWRWVLVAVLVVVLLVTLGCFLVFRPTGPYYNGKSIGYWFRRYCLNTFVPGEDTPEEVIQKLGTNALPYLVEQALSTSKDTALRTNLYLMLSTLPKSWHLPEFVSYDDRREKAIEAIVNINPPTEVILPYVQSGISSGNPIRRYQALQVFSHLKTNAAVLVPFFSTALHVEGLVKDDDSMSLILESLDDLGTNARPALPDLLWVVETVPVTNAALVTAAKCLGNFGTNAAPVIPKLLARFQIETEWEDCCFLAAAIFKIDESRHEVLEFLINGLNAPEGVNGFSKRFASVMSLGSSRFRQDFIKRIPIIAIGEIGPKAHEAIPALSRVIQSTNSAFWISATRALTRIGGSNEVFLPVMKQRLESELPEMRLTAASIVLDAEAANVEAQACLAKFINQRGQYFGPAARSLLYRAYPVAEEAKSALKAAANSDDRTLKQFAVEVLKAIDKPLSERNMVLPFYH